MMFEVETRFDANYLYAATPKDFLVFGGGEVLGGLDVDWINRSILGLFCVDSGDRCIVLYLGFSDYGIYHLVLSVLSGVIVISLDADMLFPVYE